MSKTFYLDDQAKYKVSSPQFPQIFIVFMKLKIKFYYFKTLKVFHYFIKIYHSTKHFLFKTLTKIPQLIFTLFLTIFTFSNKQAFCWLFPLIKLLKQTLKYVFYIPRFRLSSRTRKVPTNNHWTLFLTNGHHSIFTILYQTLVTIE